MHSEQPQHAVRTRSGAVATIVRLRDVLGVNAGKPASLQAAGGWWCPVVVRRCDLRQRWWSNGEVGVAVSVEFFETQ